MSATLIPGSMGGASDRRGYGDPAPVTSASASRRPANPQGATASAFLPAQPGSSARQPEIGPTTYTDAAAAASARDPSRQATVQRGSTTPAQPGPSRWQAPTGPIQNATPGSKTADNNRAAGSSSGRGSTSAYVPVQSSRAGRPPPTGPRNNRVQHAPWHRGGKSSSHGNVQRDTDQQ